MSTNTKKVHQDPAEAALSAIEEALSLDLTSDDGYAAPEAGDHDEFELPPAREPDGPRIENRSGTEDDDEGSVEASLYLSDLDLFGNDADPAETLGRAAFELQDAALDAPSLEASESTQMSVIRTRGTARSRSSRATSSSR